MGTERQRRGTRLTPEEKWQIFLEASRKNTTDVEVCRKWGITTWQLKVIRTKAKIRGTRLAVGIKLQIVRAISGARQQAVTIDRAC